MLHTRVQSSHTCQQGEFLSQGAEFTLNMTALKAAIFGQEKGLIGKGLVCFAHRPQRGPGVVGPRRAGVNSLIGSPPTPFGGNPPMSSNFLLRRARAPGGLQDRRRAQVAPTEQDS